MMKVKDIKKGDYFTLKDIYYPKESQVYVRDEYCPQAKAYFCYKFEDVNMCRLFKGDKEVFVDFIF